MQLEQFFFIIWLVFTTTIILVFLIKGRKSIKKFPEISKSDFEYMENGVSGYSCESFKTKMGGAKNILRIRITKNQLWITTNTFMAWIAEQFDLIHIIPIESIKSVKWTGKEINIEFEKNGRLKKIILTSRRSSQLLQLLSNKIRLEIRLKKR